MGRVHPYKKTVSVDLSREQCQAMRAAIANWRKAQTILTRMGQISRQMIFGTRPDNRRHGPFAAAQARGRAIALQRPTHTPAR